jgi:hypothetical protein
MPKEIKKLNRPVFWDVAPCSLINIYQTIWCYIPENRYLHTRRNDNLKSHQEILICKYLLLYCNIARGLLEEEVKLMHFKLHSECYRSNRKITMKVRLIQRRKMQSVMYSPPWH